jgi:BRCT domain type II-containing protein
MSTGGAENAITVCAKVSPDMEKRVSEKHGLTLKRVSDKYRNPSHVPDEVESKAIQRWKDEVSQGMKPAVYTQKSNGEFRVIAPIMIDNATCLKCHGSETEIDRAALEKIQVVYPDDKAKGYKMGDVRGAFSASWKI